MPDECMTDDIDALLSACDDLFYAYENDLEALQMKFIAIHRDDFT